MGRSKIQELTNEWYGFDVFSALVHVVMAIFGTHIFSVITVPLVLGFAVISLAITWVIGRALITKSKFVYVALLILSPIAFVLGCMSTWQLVTGSWSFGMLLTTLVVIGGVYMQFRSFLTLVHADVRRYFFR